jgi:hypothetical protein
MKKIQWGFAAFPLLALLATSCNKEAVETNRDDEKVITFGVATGKQTLSRAAEINSVNLLTETLFVDAYQSGTPNFFDNFELKHNEDGYDPSEGSGGWGYAAMGTFHPNYDLVYYSVHPTTNASVSYNGTDAAISYTVADEDLIAATATTTPTSTTANLTYGHLLSQVNFAIQGLTGVDITVSDIKVNNVHGSGTYLFPMADDSWTVFDDADQNYDYVAPATTTDGDEGEAIVYLGNQGGNDPAENDKTNALMLMPQTIETASTITFTYTLVDSDNDAPLSEVNASASVDLKDLSTAWLPGKRYLYTIVFESPSVIKFEVSVGDWTDDTPGTIPVNNNPNNP